MNSVTEATGECKLKVHVGGYFSNQRQFRVSSFKFRASAVVSPARQISGDGHHYGGLDWSWDDGPEALGEECRPAGGTHDL